MYWIIGYIIFAVVVGGYMGKQSLRLIKYPEQYKKWVHFLFFPMTTAEGTGIFQANGPIIFDMIGLGYGHISYDDNIAKEKRAEYILCTVVFLPLRFLWILLVSFILGFYVLISKFFSFVAKMCAKCGRCVDI